MLFAAGGAVLACSPKLLLDRTLPISDLETHYRWAFQFSRCLQEGALYPRWMPHAFHGLGEPAFVYYPPAYYYLAAIVSHTGLSIWNSMKLVELILTAATGIAGFLVCRRLASFRWSLFGAGVLQTAPMFVFIYLYYNGLSWYASIPMAVAAFYFVCFPRHESRSLDLRLSLAVAGLAMTHVLSAFMLILCLPFFYVIYLPVFGGHTREFLARMRHFVLSVTLGCGLAMIYLLPALTTHSYIHAASWRTHWFKTRTDWFKTRFSLPVVTAKIHGLDWPLFQYPIGGLLVISAVAVAGYLYCHRAARQEPWRVTAGLAAVGAVALFFSTELSYPLWRYWKALQMIQFPVRFNYIATMALTLASIGCCRMAVRSGTLRPWRAAVTAPLALMLAFGFFLGAKIVFFDGRSYDHGGHQLSAHLRFGQPEYLPARAGGHWERYALSGAMQTDCASQRAGCTEILSKCQERQWRIVTDKAILLRLPVFAYPAWAAFVDDARVASQVDPATGVIQLDVPPGSHRAGVIWIGLAEERAGALVSAVSLAVAVGLALRRWLAGRLGALVVQASRI